MDFETWWKTEGRGWKVNKVDAELIWDRARATQREAMKPALIAHRLLREMEADPLAEPNWTPWRSLPPEALS